MPAFKITYPARDVRMIEARDRRAARRLAAKAFVVSDALDARQVFELGNAGVELEE